MPQLQKGKMLTKSLGVLLSLALASSSWGALSDKPDEAPGVASRFMRVLIAPVTWPLQALLSHPTPADKA